MKIFHQCFSTSFIDAFSQFLNSSFLTCQWRPAVVCSRTSLSNCWRSFSHTHNIILFSLSSWFVTLSHAHALPSRPTTRRPRHFLFAYFCFFYIFFHPSPSTNIVQRAQLGFSATPRAGLLLDAAAGGGGGAAARRSQRGPHGRPLADRPGQHPPGEHPPGPPCRPCAAEMRA